MGTYAREGKGPGLMAILLRESGVWCATEKTEKGKLDKKQAGS